MKYIPLLFFSLSLYALDSFITAKEYAAQLYKNPRGIGCHHCHGESGEGRLIASYKHKGVEKHFSGPKIKDIAYEEFYRALNRREDGMPRYFLIDSEIEALYQHLHENDKKGLNE